MYELLNIRAEALEIVGSLCSTIRDNSNFFAYMVLSVEDKDPSFNKMIKDKGISLLGDFIKLASYSQEIRGMYSELNDEICYLESIDLDALDEKMGAVEANKS